MAQSRNFGSLVSTTELASSLDKVKVLDGSWHMPNANRDPYQEYVQQHIPGARFFGIDKIKDTTVNLPHMLPTPEVFAEAVGKFFLFLLYYQKKQLIVLAYLNNCNFILYIYMYNQKVSSVLVKMIK